MLFEADSTSAFSVETDSGTLDMHLWRTEKGKLPLIFPINLLPGSGVNL